MKSRGVLKEEWEKLSLKGHSLMEKAAVLYCVVSWILFLSIYESTPVWLMIVLTINALTSAAVLSACWKDTDEEIETDREELEEGFDAEYGEKLQ